MRKAAWKKLMFGSQFFNFEHFEVFYLVKLQFVKSSSNYNSKFPFSILQEKTEPKESQWGIFRFSSVFSNSED